MSRRAQLPDGTVLEFPDDTPDAVIDKVVKQQLGAKAAAAPKDDSALNAFVLGARKPIDNLARWTTNDAAVRVSNEADALRANNSRSGWQAAGNMLGTGLIQLATRGAGGPFVQSAGAGALLSDRDTAAGVGTDALIGGISGKVAQGALNAMSYAAKPVVSKANRMLYDAGIPQTLGELARSGKSWTAKGIAGLEDAMTSIPGLGDMVGAARGRGVDALNSAVANRALKNIGEAVPKDMEPGIEMVDFVGDRLSQKYQSLVPKLRGVFDADFATDLAAAKQATSGLPKSRQDQFATIVKDVFANRAKGAQITGQELKDAESRLTTLIKKYGKSTDADQTIMADALSQVRDALRSSVLRSNPAHAKDLQALNKGWAQLATYRNAANAAGNATGMVTPAQMLAASRQSGFRDDLARAAKATLSPQLPDSGTAKRGALMTAALMMGGGAGGATVSPLLAVPGAGAALYTKKGQDLLNAFVFGTRSKGLQNTAKGLNALARVAPAAAPALTAQRAK